MAENTQRGKPRRLMVFTVSRLEDVLAKGNVWYVRHYENYFDEVYIVYLFGREKLTLSQGDTRLISVAGRSRWVNLLLAPLRLYLFSRRVRPTVYLTGDQILSWWTGLLLRWFMNAKITLMPVSIPEQLYRDRRLSQTGLPIFIERWFIAASYRAAYRILTAVAFGDFVNWLQDEPTTKHKLIVVKTVVDALPTPAFFHSLSNANLRQKKAGPFQLIYVGRLHLEKMVDHLLRMMESVRLSGFGEEKIKLKIVGDGPDRGRLESLAKELSVSTSVEFHGRVENSELPALLLNADAFVSTLTGTSLREAAFCRLPIVAYDRDWIHGLLVHEKTALLVASGDVNGLADQVIRVAEDAGLRETLVGNAYRLALELWSVSSLKESLAQLDSMLSSYIHTGVSNWSSRAKDA